MSENKVYRAIGLMSGTSLDGIDAALIETDGFRSVNPLAFMEEPYSDELRERIKLCLGRKSADDADVQAVEADLTAAHVALVRRLMVREGLSAADVDVIGFHGQTLYHDADKGLSLQIGDGDAMARETGIDTVNDFRGADVAAGGQGAPFLPLYHRARCFSGDAPRPVAILNIGGVANVTWVGARWAEITAFDTGPGNALMDDFIFLRTGQRFDDGGALAAQGAPDIQVVARATTSDYFKRRIPKSLDRDEWADVLPGLSDMSVEDGLATLGALTVESIFRARTHFPSSPEAWYVTGGGRRNMFLMARLRDVLDVPVLPVEDLGWDGDSTEAEGFAYLAVRSVLGRPLSVPSTTGVREPVTGGVLCRAASKAEAKAV